MDPMMAPMETGMPDDMNFSSAPAWSSFDSMMPVDPMLANLNLQAGENFASNSAPYVFPFPEGCTCSAMTGPCARHLEEIKFQMSANGVSTPPTNLMPFSASPNPQGLISPALSAVAFMDAPSPFCLDGTVTPQQTPPMPQHKSSVSLSTPSSTHSYRVEKRPTHRHRRSTTSSVKSTPTSNMSSAAPSEQGSSTPATEHTNSPISSTASTAHDPTTRNTTRFNAILAAVRDAGFADFDSMVSTYYTTTFSKSSVPDMAQRASRSRRLPRLMQNLHASSKTWARWEARGFRDSVTACAAHVYVDEMRRVAEHLEMSGEGDALSALHRLRESGLAVDKSEESRLMAVLTTLPEGAAAVQDEAPRLWGLVTELAGTEGLFCDRVGQAVVALLVNGRRSQWGR
jgi:hypothetical protein